MKNDTRPTTAEEIQDTLIKALTDGTYPEDAGVIDPDDVDFIVGDEVIITGARGGNVKLNGRRGIIHSARRRDLESMDSRFIESVKARSGHLPLSEYYRVIPVGLSHMMAIEVPLDGVKEI